MAGAVPRIRRLWVTVKHLGDGRFALHFANSAPADNCGCAVLMTKGMIEDDAADWEVPIVSDPAADPDLRGPGPTQQQIADAVAAYLAAHPTSAGPAGPAGAQLLGTVTVAQTATVAIALGERTFTLPLAGVVAGDMLVLTPIEVKTNGAAQTPPLLPAGYSVQSYAATAGNVVIRMMCPLLALGASFSIKFKVARIVAG